MSREAPVRIREGLGVKLPRAIRRNIYVSSHRAGERVLRLRPEAGDQQQDRLRADEFATQRGGVRDPALAGPDAHRIDPPLRGVEWFGDSAHRDHDKHHHRRPFTIKIIGFNDFHGQLSTGKLVGVRPVGSAPVLSSVCQAAPTVRRRQRWSRPAVMTRFITS